MNVDMKHSLLLESSMIQVESWCWFNFSLVGFLCHSALLVPYFAWKLTHATHHANTGNYDKDMVWVPLERKDIEESTLFKLYYELKSPIGNLILILVILLFGWPSYILTDATSNKTFQHLRVNHFEPSSPLFKPRHRWMIIASNVGVLVACCFHVAFIYFYGVSSFLLYYFIPYLWMNAWLVGITFLQHTSKDVKYFKNSEWTFMKGALQTVDRNYGIFSILLHHITDTHVLHHIFHQIPHYHAKEATEYLKKELGDLYLYDSTPFYNALWRDIRDCKVVEGGNVKTFILESI
jgi:omega-6 fatty acid desaturase / acyl-lipid omega-6 desaturase (Delta-12 desaturase)